MPSLLQNMLSSALVLCDGAWGTQLQAAGLGMEECPDTWNLSHPEEVQRIAGQYIDAGSRVILTNTFRANRVTLGSYGIAEQTEKINQAGVKLSREAARDRAAVFASVAAGAGRCVVCAWRRRLPARAAGLLTRAPAAP